MDGMEKQLETTEALSTIRIHLEEREEEPEQRKDKARKSVQREAGRVMNRIILHLNFPVTTFPSHLIWLSILVFVKTGGGPVEEVNIMKCK